MCTQTQIHSCKHTWGRRCSPPHRSPASAHLSQALSWGCQQYIQFPTGWPLARQRRWSGGGEQGKEQQSKVWEESRWWNRDGKQTNKQYLRQKAKTNRERDQKPTFLYVVSPEASTLLWPIFFSWAGPTPNGDGICVTRKKKTTQLYSLTENSAYSPIIVQMQWNLAANQ